MRYRAVPQAIVLAGLLALTAAETNAAVPDAAAKPITCSIPMPCALATNSGAGAGFKGVSKKGPGLSGSSTSGEGVYGISGSGSYLHAGVEGESSDETTGTDAGGLFGGTALTTKSGPAYGVIAFAEGAGVYGETEGSGSSTSPGVGIAGNDPIKAASASGDYNVAVEGSTTVGTAVLGYANSYPTVSIFGEAPVGVYSTAASFSGTDNPNAFAFFGETNSFGLDVHNLVNNSSAFVSSPSDFFYGAGSTGYFYVDYNGNLTVSGTVTTSHGTFLRTSGSNGAAMLEYGGRTTAPEVEDVGEAQLANGRAYVPIDARLAQTIDRRVAYHVFVTPEGDCNGLYVTQKSASGFAVRELRGGGASLAFEYRIVAKPVDEDGSRLATAPALPKRDDDGFAKRAGSARRVPPLLSPEQRLRQRIGDQAFAEEMRRFGER